MFHWNLKSPKYRGRYNRGALEIGIATDPGRCVRAVGSDFAACIIRDFELSVQRVYLVIETILVHFYSLADIALLATIYCLLIVCFRRWHGLEWIHLPFLIILLGLLGGIMYNTIQFRIDVATYMYDSTEKLVDSYAKLDVAYAVFYLCAAIEILIWALIAFLPSRTPNTEVKVSSPQESGTKPSISSFSSIAEFDPLPLLHRHPSPHPLLVQHRHRCQVLKKQTHQQRGLVNIRPLHAGLPRSELHRHLPHRPPA